MHTPGLGVVWDSKHDVDLPIGRAHHTILPTKTSLTYGWFAYISYVFLKAGSQVSLLMVNCLLIVWFHLFPFFSLALVPRFLPLIDGELSFVA